MSSQDDKLRNAVSALLAARKTEAQLRTNLAIAAKAVPAAKTRLVDAIRVAGGTDIIYGGVKYRMHLMPKPEHGSAANPIKELFEEPFDAKVLDE